MRYGTGMPLNAEHTRAHRVGFLIGRNLVFVTLAAIVLVVLYGVVRGALQVPLKLWARVLATAVMCAVGFGLFRLRMWRLTYYALLEISVGVAVTWVAVSQVWEQGIAAWLALMTSAYLIVRGLDNLRNGLVAAEARASQK